MKLLYKTALLFLCVSLSIAADSPQAIQELESKHAQFLQDLHDFLHNFDKKYESWPTYDIPTKTFEMLYVTTANPKVQTITLHENELLTLVQETIKIIPTITPKVLRFVLEIIHVDDHASIQLLTRAIFVAAQQGTLSFTKEFANACSILMTHPGISYEWLQQEAQNILQPDEYTLLIEKVDNKTQEAFPDKPLLSLIHDHLLMKKHKESSQSELHIAYNAYPAPANLLDHFHFLYKYINEEKNVANLGWYSFAHSIQYERLFALDIYTQAWSIIYKTTFINQGQLLFHRKHPQELDLDGKAQTHAFTTKSDLDGIPEYVRRKHKNELLFLNAALFGNITNPGSCSALFALANNNISNTDVQSPREILQQFGLGHYYDKYKTDFDILEAYHIAASHCKGIILQVWVDDTLIRNVELASSGGRKKRIFINKRYPTSDPATIINAMRTHIGGLSETDAFEFIIPTIAIDDQRAAVFRFYFGPQTAVDEYYQKRDELFAKIKADYQANPPSVFTKTAQNIKHSIHHMKKMALDWSYLKANYNKTSIIKLSLFASGLATGFGFGSGFMAGKIIAMMNSRLSRTA